MYEFFEDTLTSGNESIVEKERNSSATIYRLKMLGLKLETFSITTPETSSMLTCVMFPFYFTCVTPHINLLCSSAKNSTPCIGRIEKIGIKILFPTTWLFHNKSSRDVLGQRSPTVYVSISGMATLIVRKFRGRK